MALTPEDIVNKRFQSTKFREGYDQDEVDDFLDEVVVEMRRLASENEGLVKKITASDARIAELQRSGGSSSSVGVTVPCGWRRWRGHQQSCFSSHAACTRNTCAKVF